jgi:hypothetical protein
MRRRRHLQRVVRFNKTARRQSESMHLKPASGRSTPRCGNPAGACSYESARSRRTWPASAPYLTRVGCPRKLRGKHQNIFLRATPFLGSVRGRTQNVAKNWRILRDQPRIQRPTTDRSRPGSSLTSASPSSRHVEDPLQTGESWPSPRTMTSDEPKGHTTPRTSPTRRCLSVGADWARLRQLNPL